MIKVQICLLLLSPLFSSFIAACELAAIPFSEQRMGCGCSYYFPAKPPIRPSIVLQTDLDGTNPIMMRNGKLVNLWGARPSALLIEPGYRSLQGFRYHATSIQLENMIRPGCTWGEPGCEVVGYLSQIATAENYQQCQWALQGDCGC
ncbi:hypothetical protein [Agarivorans sp. Toyoura001]|uniref:hypothetical protein n=1 Tax=unclassified Agarivorans TaxID=2636026 RepID=UPI0010D3031C|nr:hypothetical protein [Agarivorans sp. Toyoura001]GDY24452.1 hypothetical protein AHAT_03420 [Agarivorans sp. Toyoura001]